MLSNIVTGSQVGTGANIDIKLGFIPAKVTVINITSANMEQLDWYSSMADASAVKSFTGAGAAVDPRIKITANGISKLNTTFLGFRIGADPDVNVAAETLQWIAYRMGPGSGG